MTGIISYFIGTGIYDFLIEGNSRSGRTFFSFAFAVFVRGILYLVTKRMKPEVIEEMTIEQKDEREEMIRGKASQTSLQIIYALLFLGIVLLIMAGQELLSYAIGVFYIIILIVHTVSQRYYQNRM